MDEFLKHAQGKGYICKITAKATYVFKAIYTEDSEYSSKALALLNGIFVLMKVTETYDIIQVGHCVLYLARFSYHYLPC